VNLRLESLRVNRAANALPEQALRQDACCCQV